MPIAVAIGWEPSLGFTGGSPVPKGVCEYDVMGAIRGAPVDLVKCETVDLYVPATAEIVIEGYLQLDPKNHDMEGPFAEFTGYVAGDKSPKPTIRVTAITHRNNPILRGAIEGSLPGSFSENGICSSIMRASTAWNVLDRAGVPGITDVWCPPVQTGINLLIRMKSSYRNQAKQAANAIWGSSAAHVRYKHITVVDDDIDIHDYAAVDWAIAHRVNAGENDIIIMPDDVRRRPRSLDPQARPQPGAVRHRQVEPRADRRHHEPRLRPRSRARRRALPAQGLAGAEGHRRHDGALVRVRAGQAERRLAVRLGAQPAPARPWPRRPVVPATSGIISRATVGITSRLQIGDSSMPPTITQASGCWTCEPMPVESAAGTRPMQAEKPVMKTCRIRASPAWMIAVSVPMPSSRSRRM